MLATTALALAAALAGVAGSWSPCGLSAVDTIGRAAATLPTRIAACATFACGALLGGAATFAGLSALGDLARADDARGVTGAAVAVAVGAALADAAAVRVRPQVRRQVPEPWRRRLPLPLAAALYGVLLGLGFATFVLTVSLWALAALALALADVRTGLVVGLAFGAGRALPVAVLAPFARRPLAVRVGAAMAERPGTLRAFRGAAGGALACFVVALALAGDAPAAGSPVPPPAYDPSASPPLLAWQGASSGVLRRPVALDGDAHHVGPAHAFLPGSRPAVGDGLVAWRDGRRIVVARSADLAPVAAFVAPAATAIAVSARWVVHLAPRLDGGDQLRARRLGAGSGDRLLATTRPPARLGRPSLDGDRVVFHVASRAGSRIVEVDLRHGSRRTLRRSRVDQLTSPSLLGGSLLYVRRSSTAQLLELGRRVGGRDRVLYRVAATARRDRGYEPGYSTRTLTPPGGRPATGLLWTTALTEDDAYVSVLPVTGRSAGRRILRFPRCDPCGGGRTTAARPSAPATFPGAPAALAFAVAGEGGPSIHAAAPDGSAPRLLVGPPATDPAWSPDGTRLAFASAGSLYVTALDGSPPTRATSGPADADPAWAPDGRRLAFTRGRGAAQDVFTVDVAGGAETRLTRARGADQEPAWSPDGAWVAFASRRRGNWELYAVGADGTARRLTRTAAKEGYPSWSPDGRSLAFYRTTGLTADVFRLDLATGAVMRLTADRANDYDPVWSPDGSRIAFVTDRRGGPELFVMAADGTGVGPLATPRPAGLPDWQAMPSRDMFREST